MWWLLAACPDPKPAPHPQPLPPSGDTAPLEPGCNLSPDNALRIVCTWERAVSGPIEVVLSSTEEPQRSIEGDPSMLSVYIPVWDLLAETAYDWSILDNDQIVASGSVRTGALPEEVTLSTQIIQEGPTSIDRVLFAFGCTAPSMVVMDGNLRVRWYQEAGSAGLITGFDWTQDATIAALVGRSRAVEWWPDGNIRVELTFGNGLQRVLHHSVVGRDGRLFALDAEEVLYPDQNEYVIDGISSLAESGGEALWNIASVLDPQGLPTGDPFYWGTFFPGAVDFAHANSIELWEGDWLVSFKHLHTVLRIDSEDGHIVWWLAGSTSPVLFDGPKLTLGSIAGLAPSFEHQHHANPSPWGTMLLVDNGIDEDTTRVLDISIDSNAQTADVLRAWDLGVTCPVQSSAFGLPDGTVLAACAKTQELFELDRAGIRRRVQLGCANERVPQSFVRAQPISDFR